MRHQSHGWFLVTQLPGSGWCEQNSSKTSGDHTHTIPEITPAFGCNNTGLNKVCEELRRDIFFLSKRWPLLIGRTTRLKDLINGLLVPNWPHIYTCCSICYSASRSMIKILFRHYLAHFTRYLSLGGLPCSIDLKPCLTVRLLNSTWSDE